MRNQVGLVIRAVAMAATFMSACAARAQTIAVRGDLVYTMEGEPIRDGVVLIRDGVIEAVGPAAQVRVPADVQTIRGAVVTPGLVDAHTVVGLAGQYNYDHDQDQLERSKPLQPELRALDAYNPHERLVEWVRSFGVTTMHTGHAPGELISGQTMIVKTVGNTADEAAIRPVAAVACTLSTAAQKNDGSPGTRGKMAAMLRSELVKAGEYVQKRADDASSTPRDLHLEALGRVLAGELPLVVTAHRAQDIATAMRIADEFDIRLILDGAAEAYLLAEDIAAADVPVIVHPTMMRAVGETENLSFETAAKLHEAGVRIALQSGYESYVPKTRVVLYEAALAAANGLDYEQALATITIDAARMLDIDDRVGSLAAGKDGDVAIYDGDPFEYTTHCIGVVIEGRLVSNEVR